MKNSQAKNYYHVHYDMVIKMAKRMKLNLASLGFVGDKDHAWWDGPAPSFVVSLYEKRFLHRGKLSDAVQ